ncbi:MAG: TonB-dependent receptor [bacterium]
MKKNAIGRNLFILPCSLTALLFTNGFAGVTGKISGKVLDRDTREPLIGANVLIEGTSLGAATDHKGEFFILNVHAGTYAVSFSYIGYRKVTQTEVLVHADRTTYLPVSLNPSALEGEMVVITAERAVIEPDLTASEQVITTREIERSWVRTVKEALETQIGIVTSVPSLGWTRGETQTYIRGSSVVQAVYMLDNLSVNSGLLSDNYTGFNTSTIEQISLLTGGYNAEYGEGRSAVVNIVTKEASSDLHGMLITRLRPAGKYHFGPNFYSQENYDYKHFDLNYWTQQSQDPNSGPFYRQNPDSLLAAWQSSITPNRTLAKYTERAEPEIEATLLGPLTDALSFLASARYKKAVSIFPQSLAYNPEFNFQGYLNYRFSPTLKLRVGGFHGGYESADYPAVNFNTIESAQESAWLAPMRVDEQYARAKYNPEGAIYRQWPELRRWTQGYVRLTHLLNPSTSYEVNLSYLRDRMDRSDRDQLLPDSMWSRRDDTQKMINRFLDQGYFQTFTYNQSEIIQLKADFISQITTHHQIKAGLGFRQFDFSYNHFMGVYEGGNRWNLLNVFDGRPYEGNLYVQDKMEFPGLVVNAGLRMDLFNQNRTVPKNRYDPLAMQPSTPGHDPGKPLGYPGNPEREPTKLQLAFSPRLGISHPISERSVLHFVYGHFYQRPSWTKMFGFPFVNYTDDMNTVLDPYADQITYMEEWQGWYGNAEMTFERTIQYELGIDYNFANRVKLDLTGYYKDASREASVITGVYAAQYSTTKALMLSNSGYSDVRGLETKVDTRFRGPFNLGASHDIFWSFEGEVGYSQLHQTGSTRVDVPKGLRQSEGAWSSFHRLKAWANLNVEPGRGPQIAGIKPLSDFNLNFYFWWRSGEPYTYHPPGDISTKPNNQRWFNYYQANMKATKGFLWAGLHTAFSLEVRNLFDSKFLRLLYGDDLVRWHENPDLPQSERLPPNWFSGEDDEWEWYSYEVPPRQVFFQFSMEF